MGHKGTFWGNGNVPYLDCGVGSRCIFLSKLTELYTEDMCISLNASLTPIFLM